MLRITIKFQYIVKNSQTFLQAYRIVGLMSQTNEFVQIKKVVQKIERENQNKHLIFSFALGIYAIIKFHLKNNPSL